MRSENSQQSTKGPRSGDHRDLDWRNRTGGSGQRMTPQDKAKLRELINERQRAACALAREHCGEGDYGGTFGVARKEYDRAAKLLADFIEKL